MSRLQRWVAAPRLRVQARLLRSISTGASEAEGLDEVLTDDERAGLVADLTWALPQLTGNQFQAFATVSHDTASEGAHVAVLNPGAITVARYSGL